MISGVLICKLFLSYGNLNIKDNIEGILYLQVCEFFLFCIPLSTYMFFDKIVTDRLIPVILAF